MDFTFVCPTEIIAFSERIKEFEALDTAVIGASTDSGKFFKISWGRCVDCNHEKENALLM